MTGIGVVSSGNTGKGGKRLLLHGGVIQLSDGRDGCGPFSLQACRDQFTTQVNDRVDWGEDDDLVSSWSPEKE